MKLFIEAMKLPTAASCGVSFLVTQKGPANSSPLQAVGYPSPRTINNAQDNRGNRSQGLDVRDETGRIGWLRPALRLQLEYGRLNLKPGDTAFADDFICGGGQWPLLVAESIRKAN